MDINSLIRNTINFRDKILEEYLIFFNYQRSNPWHTLEMIDELKSQGKVKNIPSFDNLIKLKEDFLVDSYFKIYRQIVKKNPLFNQRIQLICYYSIIEGLYQSQLKEGLEKGDIDSKKRLVTGSDLVLNTVPLNVKSFLNAYYSICN